MPYIRLNQNYKYDTRKYDTSSNIYLSYSNEVQLLTAPSLKDMPIDNSMDCYVRFPQHNQLETYLKPNGIDGLVYVTGVTGSGKTTLLNAALKNKDNDIVINDTTAIITFVWSPTEAEKGKKKANIESNYSNFILACADRIIEEFNIKHYKFAEGPFIKYIKDNDFAFYSQGRTTNKYSVNKLKHHDPIKFSLFALRYAILNCKINNVVFLFDELEEAGRGKKGEPLEIILVEIAYRIKHILSSRTNEAKRSEKIRFTVIISCRHYVYRMITNKKTQHPNDFWSKVNAEAQSETMIDLPSSPDLSELLRKRKDVIIKTLPIEAREEFEEVYYLTHDILLKCSNVITSLAIGNIRDVYKYIQYLLFNKRWFQKKESENGAFSIKSCRSDYNLMLTSYLRCLALRENTVYTSESIIPNLLDNTNGKEDLCVLITLSFFITKQNDPELRNDFRSQYDVNIEFNSLVERIFPKKIDTFMEALNFLLHEKILLRSAFSCQEDSVDEPNVSEEIDKWKNVYLSSQANVLWKLLGQNSVLFEMFIDDIKIDNCIQCQDDLAKRSYLQFNELSFKECINYLNSMVDYESLIWEDLLTRSFLKDYKENFGETPIVKHLYNGLSNSFQTYYKNKEDSSYVELKTLLDDTKRRIDTKDIFK